MPREKKQIILPPNIDDSILWGKNIFFAGVDEAGRGCIAGPVVAAAVILPANFENKYGINDSKLIRPEKRDELFDIITNSAITFSVGIIDNELIDNTDILKCTMKAMHLAISKLSSKPEFLLIDGNYFTPIDIPHKTIVKGDSASVSIAAASILAKVTRDRIMLEFHDKYPFYYFNEHKGYGTKKHYTAIDNHGICPIHRISFLKKYYNRQTEMF